MNAPVTGTAAVTRAAPVALGTAAVAAWIALRFGWRQGVLFLVGAGAGVVLYHAAFGFTSAWRVLVSDRRGAGVRAQMLLLALTSVVFFPVIALGDVWGQPVRGAVAPVGIPVVAGAFLFGVGMQLGGGCASGTLYAAGGGNVRMLIVLACFAIGTVLGTAHGDFWAATPTLGPISLIETWGPWPALALSLLVFAALAAATRLLERRRHGATSSLSSGGAAHWLRGPWPLVAGATGLTLVNITTMLVAGRPWGITAGIGLWGAKASTLIGIDVASWPYWSAPARRATLEGSIFADVTSVMDLGIMAGALLAARLAGRFSPSLRLSGGSLVSAVIGGLLLGYGARTAYGCNIGAYVGGIVSGSLHGWLWLVAGFAGSIVGTRLRPLFGLTVERTKAC